MPDGADSQLRRLTSVPLGGSYAAAVALALFALCPFIVLTSATALFEKELMADLGTTQFGVQLSGAMANAAYAFGAVVSADLIQRLPRRRVFLACEIAFVAASLMALLAGGIGLFLAGRLLQGLVTGMLLVAALPPLVIGHGPERLPSTAAFINLGLFGMVTLGPVLGGFVAGPDAWRVLFAAVAAAGAVGLVVGALAFEANEPPRPGMGFDWLAIPLAAGATFLPFFGVSWLTLGGFASAGFLVPLTLGLAILVTLVVVQYRKREPLMPMKLISHTLPVAGTGAAMLVGAAFTALIELVEIYLLDVLERPPAAVGGLLASQLLGIALAAWLFKRLLPTKWIPVLALSGLLVTTIAGALLLALSASLATPLVLVAGALLGYGAGAGVAPGLFMAGLSVPSSRLGPTFALVELLRSEAAFLVGPVLLSIAMASSALAGGIELAIVITLGILVAGGALLVGTYLLGGARPHEPDLERWLEDGEVTAFHSPPFAALVRPGKSAAPPDGRERGEEEEPRAPAGVGGER